MSVKEIVGEIRELKGKNKVKQCRANHKVPAIVYGLGKDDELVQVDYSDMVKLYHTDFGRNIIFDLVIGKEKQRVITNDIQYNVLNQMFIHMDFKRVDQKSKVVVEIPVKLTGVCPGVKMGGVLIQKMKRLKVECSIDNIAPALELDISDLQVNGFIKVNDVLDNFGVKVLSNPHDTIVRVASPRVQVESTDLEDEEAAEEAGTETAESNTES